jgi:hypothetical protein
MTLPFTGDSISRGMGSSSPMPDAGENGVKLPFRRESDSVLFPVCVVRNDDNASSEQSRIH